MKYSAIAIANAFIEEANNGKTNNLTPMKLQKLMFFTQSWYVKSNYEILFDGYFERWQYGPVLPEIYHEFKKFGSREIHQYGTSIWNEFGRMNTNDYQVKEFDKIDTNDYQVNEFLKKILDTYGVYTGTELSWMTHQPETAWYNGQLGTVINLQDMIDGKV